MDVDVKNSEYRLLGIFAHPDDESFGPDGTLARYAAEGVDVHILIMTDGAVGSVDPEATDETGSEAGGDGEQSGGESGQAVAAPCPAPGQNLLLNPSFEDGLTSWTTSAKFIGSSHSPL